MTKHTQRRRAFQSGLTMVILGAVLGVAGLVTNPAGASSRPLGSHQITICHATHSASKPYTSPHPAKWQITAPNGHDTHEDDIIPPFDAGSKGSHTWEAYPGKNWDTEGQTIWNAGCRVEDPGAGSVTLDKVTAGDGQPAGTTQFTFSVSCESGTVPSATPSIAPDDAALVVATGVTEGDSCTIDETGTAGGVPSFSVDGGPAAPGPVVVTIDDADQVVQVVVTNTYSCPEGTIPDGDGGCEAECEPTTENNQCVPCPTGTPDGQGNCPTPVDACPTVDGVQTDVSECPVQVIGGSVTPNPTPPVEVKGVQVTAAELPRTGSTSVTLAQLGFGLLLMGAGAMIFGRDEAITV